MIFDDLKAFVAVMELGSITRAANKLSLTQSAVSRRIQSLEDSLQVQLFNRSIKPPTPAAIAHRIYEYAVPLLKDVKQLIDAAHQDATPFGTFRLGLTQMASDIAVFKTISGMKATFPKLDFQIQTSWSAALQHLLEQGRLDAATLMLPSPSSPLSGMAGKHIATLNVLIVQSKAHRIVKGKTSIKSLSSQDWILNPQGCGYRLALQRAMENVGADFRLSVDTHDTESQLQMVSSGLGLGMVPKLMLDKSAYKSELSVVEVTDFALKLDLWLMHPENLGNLKAALDIVALSLSEGFKKRQTE